MPNQPVSRGSYSTTSSATTKRTTETSVKRTFKCSSSRITFDDSSSYKGKEASAIAVPPADLQTLVSASNAAHCSRQNNQSPTRRVQFPDIVITGQNGTNKTTDTATSAQEGESTARAVPLTKAKARLVDVKANQKGPYERDELDNELEELDNELGELDNVLEELENDLLRAMLAIKR